ncbi:MAG: bifunctional phosphoglucose/phosphomannose isomerase [Chloroflexi bacterium]|nr:bifunctional phosphoglucose/phosphomannose isomerase [Chloroflexota bacterium]
MNSSSAAAREGASAMTLRTGDILDDRAAMARFDQSGMLAAIATVPHQLRDAWRRTRELELPESHRGRRAVAVLGMGGSAIGGDLAASAFADRLRVPLHVIRGYELPAWVRPDVLVVASSFSGATEETISSLGTALERRCPVVVVSTGGPLREVAARAGLPLLAFPGGGQPRVAVGYSFGLLCGLLERAGLLELDEGTIEEAASVAASTIDRFGPEVPSQQNTAKQLAWTLVDRLPIIEASGPLAVVARRWKTQLNENSKTMAVAEELPEATHNTVVGYGQPESIRDHLYVIFLASPLEHPRDRLRASLSAELLGAAQIGHQVVPVAGETRLAQTLSAVVLGDLVSTYLSFLYGQDPSPVDAIAYVKKGMSATDEGDDE